MKSAARIVKNVIKIETIQSVLSTTQKDLGYSRNARELANRFSISVPVVERALCLDFSPLCTALFLFAER